MSYVANATITTLESGGYRPADLEVVSNDTNVYAFAWPSAISTSYAISGSEIVNQNGAVLPGLPVPTGVATTLDLSAIAETANGLFVDVETANTNVAATSALGMTVELQNGTTYTQSIIQSDFITGVGLTSQQSGTQNPQTVSSLVSYYDFNINNDSLTTDTSVRVLLLDGFTISASFTVAQPAGIAVYGQNIYPVLATRSVALSNGDYAVEWTGQAISGGVIFQFISFVDASGDTLGTYSLAWTQSIDPAIAMAPTANGGLAIAYWTKTGIDFETLSLPANPSLPALKTSTVSLVSPVGQTNVYAPAIAQLTTGDYVVAWLNGTAQEVEAQIVDPSGNLIGPPINVSGTDPNVQTQIGIAALAGGAFAVDWEDFTLAGVASVKSQAFGLVAATPPTLSLSLAQIANSPTNVSLSGAIDAADAGLTISIYDGATLLGSALSNASGAWSTTVTLSATGSHTLTAQATNAGGAGVSNAVTDLVSGSGSLSGGGQTVFFASSGEGVSLSNTSGNWDWVSGSNGAVYANSAQSSVSGGGDYLNLSGSGDAVSLYNTSGNWDTINGSNSVIYLNSAQATVTGGSDTLVFSGSGNTATVSGASENFVFQKALGLDVITGFSSGDTMQLSASDFASWTALSNHMTQSGLNTVISLDASDTITLTGVTASNLQSSQFHLV